MHNWLLHCSDVYSFLHARSVFGMMVQCLCHRLKSSYPEHDCLPGWTPRGSDAAVGN